MLGQLRGSSPGLDSEPLGRPLFPPPAGPVSALSPIWRKRGTRKSRLETKTENEASSALLAHLWCHLPLQNPANRAENLIRLCSATVCKTGWRMVQVGAIRSRLETLKQEVTRPRRGPSVLSKMAGARRLNAGPGRTVPFADDGHERGNFYSFYSISQEAVCAPVVSKNTNELKPRAPGLRSLPSPFSRNKEL